ncbi:MAG: hypothetical protein QM530_02300 [Phycisphaerales bacterium]|nr:hypothetical protein [Phycisphaerales bacterium]
MKIYRFVEKLKHYCKAKNLHGTHSPFVYDFVAQILNAPSKKLTVLSMTPSTARNSLSTQKLAITECVIAHYAIRTVHFDQLDTEHTEESKGASLWLFSSVNKVILPIKEEDVIIVAHIHASKKQQEQWKLLVQKNPVRLSIEIFDMGFLFFRKDFIVQQHFLLRPKIWGVRN